MGFDRINNTGFVTGDLELMGVPREQVDSKLQNYVMTAMGSYGRAINDPTKKYVARVMFIDRKEGDDIKGGDLITKKFKLIFAQ